MSLPGTKAQLKPSFVKKKGEQTEDGDGDVKKEKKDKKDKGKDKDKKREKAGSDEEDEMTEQERDAKVKDWLSRGQSVQNGHVEEVQTVLVNGTASTGVFGNEGDAPPKTPEMRPVPGGSERTDPGAIPEGLEKMQLVVKWGGESTHSSRYQSRDLGDAFKKVSTFSFRFCHC
jgi:inositol hexakisphosphate/diphosphoinositol-pentakisphosphate kinase